MEPSGEGCEDQMAFGSYAVDLRMSKKATHTPIILALRWQRLAELSKCEASLDYTVSFRLDRAT